jgi:hypothetical protein
MGAISNTPEDSASALKSPTILQLNNVVSSLCGLFAQFLQARSFVFNTLQTLLPKTGGWGGTELSYDPALSFVRWTATSSPSPHWRTIRSQGARTHTESRRQRWWHISQKISATRAAPFVRGSRCGIRAQPMASRFTQLVDALNGESRQILHRCLRNCV